MCRYSARSALVKSVLASAQFNEPKEVLAKFITEVNAESTEAQVLAFQRLNIGGRGNRRQSNFRDRPQNFEMQDRNDQSENPEYQYWNDGNNENYGPNHRRNFSHNNYNGRYQNRQNDNNNHSVWHGQNDETYNDTDFMGDNPNAYDIRVMHEDENEIGYENEPYNNSDNHNWNEYENAEHNNSNNYNEIEYENEWPNYEQEQNERQIFTIKTVKQQCKNDYVTLRTSISRDARKFLLDSEGDGCFIKYNALMGSVKINRMNKTCITGITPNKIFTYGTVLARINFGKFFVNQIFHVIPSFCRIPYDGLIGNDFMHRFNCILNYGNSSFVIRSRWGSAKIEFTNPNKNFSKNRNGNITLFRANGRKNRANVKQNYPIKDSSNCFNENSEFFSNSNKPVLRTDNVQIVVDKTEMIKSLNESIEEMKSIKNSWFKNKNKVAVDGVNKGNCQNIIENWRSRSTENISNENKINDTSIRKLSR